MATYREHDHLLELLEREHAELLACIAAAGAGDVARDLDEIAARISSLEAAEHEVLGPVLARVAVHRDTQLLIEDCRDNRAQQLDAVRALAHTKPSHQLWKVRVLQLRELVHHHATQQAVGMIPVLRSQLPRVAYRSLANAFGARHATARDQAAGRRAEPVAAAQPVASAS